MKKLNNNIIVEILEGSNPTSSSNLYIPQAETKYLEAKVVRGATGDLPELLKEGMIVWIMRNVGTRIKMNGKDCLILRQDEILLIP